MFLKSRSFCEYKIFTEQVSNDPPILVKPSKIVAGHEPEQTNHLLQRIALIISNKINTSPIANGEAPIKAKSKKDDSPTKPKARKSSDPKVKVARTTSKDVPESKKIKSKISKETSQEKKPKKIEKQKTIKDLDLESENLIQQNSSVEPPENEEKRKLQKDSSLEQQENTHKRKKSGDRKSSSGGSRKSSAEKKPTPEERKLSGRKQSASDRKLSIPEEPLQDILKIDDNEANNLTKPEDVERNSPSLEEKSNVDRSPPNARDATLDTEKKSGKLLKDISHQPEKKLENQAPPPPLVRQNSILSRPRTSLRPPSARPPSARPGAPRRRDKSIEIILQPNEISKIGGVNVKVESFNSELEDDGENLIVIENSNIEEDILGSKQIDDMHIDDEEHQKGHLVQQILETQKELVQGDKQDIEKALKERKNRQTSATQLDSLRGLIQALTKAVNPTGKLLDFIPEDVDSMQLELTMWRDSYSQSAAELKREKR